MEIEPARLRDDEVLSRRDVVACRTALDELQWLAVQTQPQLCARCNLLLTEITTSGTMATAREIQQMIGEIRRENFKLEFRRLPDVHSWKDMVFISMGDQAHCNRPEGDSTGGLITLAAGPGSLDGTVSPMLILGWRTWKLLRKAIGSNDAEVQSSLEASIFEQGCGGLNYMAAEALVDNDLYVKIWCPCSRSRLSTRAKQHSCSAPSVPAQRHAGASWMSTTLAGLRLRPRG